VFAVRAETENLTYKNKKKTASFENFVNQLSSYGGKLFFSVEDVYKNEAYVHI